MALIDFTSSPTDASGNLTANQVNIAWQDKYGEAAPAKVISDFVGHLGGRDSSFYQRVERGDFNPEVFGIGGAGTGAMSFQESVTSALRMAQEANKPAIQTMQGQVDPLNARYKTLLDSIKGIQKTATDRQTVITSNEMGKRGLLGSSTLAQQEVQNALQPVNSEYNNLYANTGIAQEKDIGNINSIIAQLQAGAASQGLSLGSNAYNTNVAQQQNKIAADWAKKVYEETTLPESRATVSKTLSSAAFDPYSSWLKAIGRT